MLITLSRALMTLLTTTLEPPSTVVPVLLLYVPL